MDRFIETQILHRGEKEHSLKSNMDRFIEKTIKPQASTVKKFKIQYG